MQHTWPGGRSYLISLHFGSLLDRATTKQARTLRQAEPVRTIRLAIYHNERNHATIIAIVVVQAGQDGLAESVRRRAGMANVPAVKLFPLFNHSSSFSVIGIS